MPDPAASGRLRTVAVGIGQAVFLPLEGPQLIAECFAQVLDTAAAIQDPLEQAFFAMVHLPYLQPFEDGNKRTARVLANSLLLRHNYAPLSYRSVDEREYKEATLIFYEQNSIQPFRELFVEQYVYSATHYNIAL